ncbi:hypothetical protein L195_g012390 [Trifolium pratense]|uniref:Uncharacterized protein n=1 Tax=Trifolium pratense TaxID=57577 RepID=A0A2K3PK75_TRIPR|nr:hypothetical protein L195_g012390 [Trifolium pratense]
MSSARPCEGCDEPNDLSQKRLQLDMKDVGKDPERNPEKPMIQASKGDEEVLKIQLEQGHLDNCHQC